MSATDQEEQQELEAVVRDLKRRVEVLEKFVLRLEADRRAKLGYSG